MGRGIETSLPFISGNALSIVSTLSSDDGGFPAPIGISFLISACLFSAADFCARKADGKYTPDSDFLKATFKRVFAILSAPIRTSEISKNLGVKFIAYAIFPVPGCILPM